MSSRLEHARGLALLFQSMLAMTGAGVTCGALVTSCGAAVVSTREPANCKPLPSEVGHPYCGAYIVELAPGATASACGFDDGSGAPDRGVCAELCGSGYSYGSCHFVGEKNAVSCDIPCVVDGRRPPALVDAPMSRATLGEWFATMAFHEAASVDAFAILSDELRAHSAPASLLRSIERARRDERRHARLAGALARRHGGVVRRPRVKRSGPRDLYAIALENAREGCARETLGALVGTMQAERAETEELRAFYAAIARDEVRHAALSWRMHAWLLGRLPSDARREVENEVAASLSAMRLDVDESLRRALGLPEDLDPLRSALLSEIYRTQVLHECQEA